VKEENGRVVCHAGGGMNILLSKNSRYLILPACDRRWRWTLSDGGMAAQFGELVSNERHRGENSGCWRIRQTW
jgi:hypothetical protein